MNGRLLSIGFVGLLAAITFGCSKELASVGVHAVNHTEDEFTYALKDPLNPKNTVGGESIGSFGAGGIACCYAIPTIWEPGRKVTVEVEVWFQSLPKGPKGTVVKTYSLTMDIPKSAMGKPSELWLVRQKSGEFEMVASNVDPTHTNWPGKVKGWPVVSPEYRQKMILREIADAEKTLKLFEEEKIEMKNNLAAFAQERWNLDQEYGKPADLEDYSGPQDKKYIAHLQHRVDAMIVSSQEKLALLRKEIK